MSCGCIGWFSSRIVKLVESSANKTSSTSYMYIYLYASDIIKQDWFASECMFSSESHFRGWKHVNETQLTSHMTTFTGISSAQEHGLKTPSKSLDKTSYWQPWGNRSHVWVRTLERSAAKIFTSNKRCRIRSPPTRILHINKKNYPFFVDVGFAHILLPSCLNLPQYHTRKSEISPAVLMPPLCQREIMPGGSRDWTVSTTITILMICFEWILVRCIWDKRWIEIFKVPL